MRQSEQARAEERIYETRFAPAVLLFADWTLKEARKHGKKRLYFLARDAYQPFLAARQIAEKRGIPIECRYLEGSRYAWRLPEYHLLGKEAADRLCTGGIDITLRKILRRGGLTEEEITRTAERLHMRGELDQIRSYGEVKALIPKLRDSQYLLSCIQARSKAAYHSAIAYFRQEGLFDTVPCGIVDSGWTGTVQQTLKNLLRSAKSGCADTLEGYYFGLYELPPGAEPGAYHTFFFAPYRDIRKKARFSNCLFEAVVSEPRGMTIGYQCENGVWKPIRETEENPNSQRIRQNIRRLNDFLSAGKDKIETEDASRALRPLLTLMSKPKADEAACLGTYWFCDDMRSLKPQPVARALTEEDLRNQRVGRRFLLMKGRRNETLKESAWPEGSIVNNGRDTAGHLRQTRLYKTLVYLKKRVLARKWRIKRYEARK